ncbi:MAG: restriction endonuclease subunit S [Clostridia bacterium]|nr:restriction endonuclease subunit S [Clostridia bacterium]
MITYKLPDFCNYVMGQSPSSQFYNSNREGLPFLQGCTTFGRMFPTFDTWTTQYTRTCKPNDVLMSVRAPVGDLNLSQDVIALGRGVAALSLKQGDNRYLYYLLMANRQKLSSCSTGTIYESISKAQLENIEFEVHEPEKQRHIVDTVCQSSLSNIA